MKLMRKFMLMRMRRTSTWAFNLRRKITRRRRIMARAKKEKSA